MAASVNDLFASLPSPSDALLNEIVVDLGLSGSPDAEEFKRTLAAHARSFALGRHFDATLARAHKSRDHAASASKNLAEARGHIAALSPIVSGFLAVKLEEDGGCIFMDAIRGLERLEMALFSVGQARPATKQPDLTLWNAIGGLMLFLEMKTGRRAAVSPRRSHSGKEPSLTSPEARAIATLLRLTQPKLEDTTIVNQILAIRRKFRGRQLTDFAGQLLLGEPVY